MGVGTLAVPAQKGGSAWDSDKADEREAVLDVVAEVEDGCRAIKAGGSQGRDSSQKAELAAV